MNACTAFIVNEKQNEKTTQEAAPATSIGRTFPYFIWQKISIVSPLNVLHKIWMVFVSEQKICCQVQPTTEAIMHKFELDSPFQYNICLFLYAWVLSNWMIHS